MSSNESLGNSGVSTELSSLSLTSKRLNGCVSPSRVSDCLVQQYYIVSLEMLHKVMSPTTSSSLPRYLADGLPKQDDEALRDAREYIDKLLAAREQHPQEPVTEDDLPENTQLLENELNSAVYLEYRTCGDETCSCMSDGDKHGPYKYRAYRDGDTVRREYIGKAKADDN